MLVLKGIYVMFTLVYKLFFNRVTMPVWMVALVVVSLITMI